ncbi:MAG: hypothetical protein HOM55_11200 [Proteobacteria bacterium]|nr:hypothetical protein [Pseudomonadota bacterium]
MKLTGLAKEFIASAPLVSPFAIDATVGNGHDTVFLAELVGPDGHVHAFDNQAIAVNASEQYLAELGWADRATIHLLSHADMLGVLPKDCAENIGACMFNLGYLPGSDHLHTTQTKSTLCAMEICSDLLCTGGRMSILCYPGHTAGGEETVAVMKWYKTLDPKRFEILEPVSHQSALDNQNTASPVLLCLTRW